MDRNRHFYITVHTYKGESFPSPGGVSAIVTLGCPTSVSEFMSEDWSRRLYDYLDEVIACETPYLGICYGAQIMAANRGASVLPNRPKEIGVYTVTLNEDGKADPVFKGFPERFPVFHWHGDMFDVPLGGALLATGEACKNQAYRVGKAVGLQFHLEVDPGKVPIWCAEYAEELPEVGKSAEEVLAEYKKVEAETARLHDLLLGNFLGSVAQ
ncbi:MAG TPA: type 1 glutamine amidotransferase [candidate division Zixibacteria bacterium]|nr:type 1 glutamine amidotransferase [candidate division Zixibacteria bacterium]